MNDRQKLLIITIFCYIAGIVIIVLGLTSLPVIFLVIAILLTIMLLGYES